MENSALIQRIFRRASRLSHWPECRGTKYERQEPHGRKNKCGPGQPPKPHCSWSFLSHLPPLDGGRNFEPYSAHMERRICPKRPQNRDPAITKLLSSTVASGPFLLNERDGGGGRNARTTSSAYAHFWNVPQQFTLENRWLPLAHRNHPASSGTSHVFDEPTL